MPNHRRAFLICPAVLAFGAPLSAQPSLSGMTFWRAQADGSPEPGGGYWNTQQPCCESTSNIYLTRVPDALYTPAAVINNGPGGDPAFTAPLVLGDNTFYFYASSWGWPRYGANLFFGGTPASPAQAPGISVLNVTATPTFTAIAPSLPGAPNPCTFTQQLGCVASPGVLAFTDGPYTVSLAAFEVLVPGEPALIDRVGGLSLGPDRAGDNYGVFTLRVTTTAAPEPAAALLLGTGILVAALAVRRRRPVR